MSVDTDVAPAAPARLRARGAAAHAGDWMERLLIWTAALALAAEIGVLLANMVARLLFDTAFTWAIEVGELAITVITFAGAAVAYRRAQHLSIQALVNLLPAAVRRWVGALAEWAVLVTSAALSVLAIGELDSASGHGTVVLGISDVWPLLALVTGTACMALFAAGRLLAYRLPVILSTAALIGIGAIVVAWFVDNYAIGSDGAMAAAGIAFVVLLFLGVPIAFVFGAASLLYAYLVQTIPLDLVGTSALNSSQGVLLLAIPIFLLAGDLMTSGGLTRPMAELVSMLVARVRGGLGQVAVVTMLVFGGVSGSQLGDVAAVGRAMEHMFDREDYPRAERAAVLAAGAAMGQSIPPSIGLLVLASATTLSVGAVFVAGILPAAAIALCLMVMIFLRSPSGARSATRARPRELAAAAMRSIPALLVPIIIVGGIATGLGTPTEASSLAVAFALLLAVGLYRNVSGRGVLELVGQSAVMAGMLVFIISLAAAFTEMLTLATIPQQLADALGSITGEAWLFLVIVVLALIVMGAVLEGLPAILVLAPILMPLADDYGIDELHFGIVMLIALGIGAFAPPIGIGMYTACAVTDSKIEQVMKPMLPYLVTLVVGVLIVAFVPFLCLALPEALGLGR